MTRIDIQTTASSTGTISVGVHCNGQLIGQKTIDTRDQQVRASLIDLGWNPPRPMAFKALARASILHAEHKRRYTDEPYILHLIEVAGLMLTVNAPDVVVCAAYLHDSIEDQGYSHPLIANEFGPETADMVVLLSDLELGNRAARKAAARRRLGGAPPWVQSIKCADLISNASSIYRHDSKFAPVFRDEARLLLDVMPGAEPRLYEMARQVVG